MTPDEHPPPDPSGGPREPFTAGQRSFVRWLVQDVIRRREAEHLEEEDDPRE